MKYLYLFFFLNVLGVAHAQFNLEDFLADNALLDHQTDSIYNRLNETQRIGQMIITSAGINGKSDAVVKKLVQEGKAGSVIYMKSSKAENIARTKMLNELAKSSGTLPLIYSMDAEPSLFNGRVVGSQKMMKTNAANTVALNRQVAKTIDNELLDMGVRHNYAPVCDLSTDNVVISTRSYGSSQAKVAELSGAFIAQTQQDGIVATAKHFPGHGLVKGDTHKQSVYIDGELKELDVYKPLIKNGVLSIMVGHMTIRNNEKYNTNGLPASCSPKIMNGLLKEEMGFKGLVTTDALNIMKAVTIIDDAPLKASMAGADLLCMPQDENAVIASVKKEMAVNVAYKKQVELSVKKIIRMKLCMNLFQAKAYEPIQEEKKYVFYLHGRIVEEQGIHAKHEQYGNYEYLDILKSLNRKNLVVISEARSKKTDVDAYAKKVKSQIDSLLERDVSPRNITVVGASRGGYIAMLVSSKLAHSEINYVFLGICSEDIFDKMTQGGNELYGHVLSIYEKSDKYGNSCKQGVDPNKVIDFKEVELNTQLQHGFLYKPLPQWVQPTLDWVEKKH